jgi:hypothetical protein
MGKARLELDGVEYFIKPLSLDDFDQAARQLFRRLATEDCFSAAELVYGVEPEFLTIEGAITPPIRLAPQEHWPPLVEEFRRVNPFYAALAAKLKSPVRAAEAEQKDLMAELDQLAQEIG